MKQCKSCKQEIDPKATKCPHCHTDQRNWFSRHKVITAIIAIIVVFGIIGAASSGTTTTDSSSENKTESTSNESKPTTAGIGEPAKDGKFEFVVKSIECGKDSVGTNEFLTKKAQGQFCLLNITVKNIGDEPQSLFADNQYLFNASNQKYSADSVATTYAAPEGSTWYSEINPGNSVEGAVVFDIPKDQVPATAELHDSAFSGGIKVNLK